MTQPNPTPPPSQPDTDFTPVPRRPRHDGWTPERQVAFIDALTECGCVTEAAQAVGISVRSAYRMRAHPDARAFRLAWDNAIEFAMLRLQDAVVSRAINGVVVPHFYKGEQVGEHRRYDERLAIFLLRTRKPAFYGPHAEQIEAPVPTDLYAEELEKAVEHIESGAPLSHPGPRTTEQPRWMQAAPVEAHRTREGTPEYARMQQEDDQKIKKILWEKLRDMRRYVEEAVRREYAGLPPTENSTLPPLPDGYRPPDLEKELRALREANNPPPPAMDAPSDWGVDGLPDPAPTPGPHIRPLPGVYVP